MPGNPDDDHSPREPFRGRSSRECEKKSMCSMPPAVAMARSCVDVFTCRSATIRSRSQINTRNHGAGAPRKQCARWAIPFSASSVRRRIAKASTRSALTKHEAIELSLGGSTFLTSWLMKLLHHGCLGEIAWPRELGCEEPNPSQLGDAAIDYQFRTQNVAGRVAGKEQCGLGNVLRLTDPAQRHSGHRLILKGPDPAPGCVGGRVEACR